MAKFQLLRETGKRRTYVVTDPVWNAWLSAHTPPHDDFTAWFEEEYGEHVTDIAHGNINKHQWYFKTFYIAHR